MTNNFNIEKNNIPLNLGCEFGIGHPCSSQPLFFGLK